MRICFLIWYNGILIQNINLQLCVIRKMEITLLKYENHNLLRTFQIFLIIVLPYKTLMILAQPFFFFLFFLLSYNYVVSHTRDCLDDNLNIYLFNICRETSTLQILIKIKFITSNYKRNLTMATYNFEQLLAYVVRVDKIFHNFHLK